MTDEQILKKYFGWTKKDFAQYEESHSEKIVDTSKPFWSRNGGNGCIGCSYLKLVKNISGYEAKCTVKTEQGRMITWRYGLDEEQIKIEIKKALTKAPSWCKLKGEKA